MVALGALGIKTRYRHVSAYSSLDVIRRLANHTDVVAACFGKHKLHGDYLDLDRKPFRAYSIHLHGPGSLAKLSMLVSFNLILRNGAKSSCKSLFSSSSSSGRLCLFLGSDGLHLDKIATLSPAFMLSSGSACVKPFAISTRAKPFSIFLLNA